MPTYSMITANQPEVYKESDGTCYTGSGTSGMLIETLAFEVSSTETTVAFTVLPRTSTIAVPEEEDTPIAKVPSTHGGSQSWALSGSTTTITFTIPTGSGDYGWDYGGTETPTPLKIKVRVKRP